MEISANISQQIGPRMTFDFYEHPVHTETASREGCELCALFSQGPWQHLVERAKPPDKNLSQMYVSVTHAREGRQKTYATIKKTLDEPQMIHCRMEGRGYYQAFFPFGQTAHQAPLASDREQWFLNHTESEQTFDCIKSWLSECTATHPSCKLRESILPTRVIDVGPSNWSQNQYYSKLAVELLHIFN